uniref:HDC08783 n=1 Tax=Drosophila melanogaster TaxID=7227 RepID=Q6ILP7_DROME|nr:TPA_inf: HDC08783 [Drosophila melanogaster]
MNTSGDKLEPVVLGNVVALQVVDLVSRSTRTCFRPAALSPRAFSRVLSSAKAHSQCSRTQSVDGTWDIFMAMNTLPFIVHGSGNLFLEATLKIEMIYKCKEGLPGPQNMAPPLAPNKLTAQLCSSPWTVDAASGNCVHFPTTLIAPVCTAACHRHENINYTSSPWKVDLRVRHILHVKIGSGQSHSLCYGGTMGNGYFRTSQTSSSSRQREKRLM